MNTNIIKNRLTDYINKEVIIKYDLGRNKTEEYGVIISELYNYIFIVELKDTSELKSFMYSDVITGTIKINYK